MRRSTVLSLPLQLVFPGSAIQETTVTSLQYYKSFFLCQCQVENNKLERLFVVSFFNFAL
jgi:hypothetical protein